MAKLATAHYDLGALDRLASGDSWLHRLDPRAKLVTTFIFILTVVSFGKYEIAPLLPFFLYPAVLLALGDLPVGYLARKLLWVAPFALLVGLFNPLLDRQVLLQLGTLEISGGWLSLGSILLRFLLTVSAALILIASTGLSAVCMALERLGAPRIFALQLLLLYRYLFVLVDEAGRLVRARALRTFDGRGGGLRPFGNLIGQLLLRALDRAQRLHLAMLCRGFTGEIHRLRPLRIGWGEVAFVLGWSALFVLFRLVPLPRLLGALILEIAA
ncbi:MAG: cobalt ECF transporter T component CbiQ [Desulfuromonadales bacterium]|nr:cobalt ECF transporter T component CbiQ [Desulfuromonadales bacterium]